MKQVAHRVHEDRPRLFPTMRLVEAFRSELEIEALLVRMARHSPPALCEGLRVTMGAPRRNLRTESLGSRSPRSTRSHFDQP